MYNAKLNEFCILILLEVIKQEEEIASGIVTATDTKKRYWTQPDIKANKLTFPQGSIFCGQFLNMALILGLSLNSVTYKLSMWDLGPVTLAC